MRPKQERKSKRRTRASSSKEADAGKVTYRVFGGGPQLHEVPLLDDFLASAVTHKWIILLHASKLPHRPNAWCPSLQPKLLETGELAKQIKGTNCLSKLVVADVSNPLVQDKIQEIVDEESACVSMLNLLHEEDADDAAAAAAPAKKIEHAMTDVGKEKGDSAVDIEEEKDVLMAEQGIEQEKGDPKRHGEVVADIEAKPQVDDDESSTKQEDDRFFFEGGRVIYKGQQLSSLEMMAQLLNGQQALQNDMKEVKTDIKLLKDDMKEVKTDIKLLKESLSATAERVCRCSLALLYSQYRGAQVLFPVTSRWVPYNPTTMGTQPLEHLALLHAKSPEDTNKKDPSGLVEIDMLFKILNQESAHRVYTSPMTVKSSRLSLDRVSNFTHLVVGEYSRSSHLCASATAYQHPRYPCRTASAKLLKKLIQVERGIVASLFYYDAAGDAEVVDAAVVVSPSFKQLMDPDNLLREVLSHTQGALPNVSRLARERRMWLIDA